VAIANEEQAKYWSELAPIWLELEELLELVNSTPGRLAMERLALQPGERVVDLGCGAGRTTTELAERASPGGTATGVDIAGEMIAYARSRFTSPAIEFVVADAQSDDLGQAAFDRAYSRFGVMFYADPVEAFSNIRRALTPAGRLSFVCWQRLVDNEWMVIPCEAAASVFDAAPPIAGPEEPGPFSFADPDRIRSILERAGFRQVEITPQNDWISIPEGRHSSFAAQAVRLGALRELLRDAHDDTRARVLEAIEQALAAKTKNGEARLARGFNLVTAAA
jgi:SAM-dependent methyltransferase